MKAAEWIAEAIAAKQQLKKERTGLTEADHEMFRRALNGYNHTEIEIAEFRRRQPYGTCDPRVNKDWEPRRTSTVTTKPKRSKSARPQDFTIRSTETLAKFGKLRSLLGSYSGSTGRS